MGLGNPGSEYERSRHNAGADTVLLLASRHGGSLKRDKASAVSTEVVIGGRRVALAIPTTYYNDSGLAVAALARRHDLDDPDSLARVVIVHDELDLPVGKL